MLKYKQSFNRAKNIRGANYEFKGDGFQGTDLLENTYGGPPYDLP